LVIARVAPKKRSLTPATATCFTEANKLLEAVVLMREKLVDEHPLLVYPTLACEIGVSQAMVLQQIHYWVTKNAENNKNFQDGHYWTYNTYAGWQENFPFLKVDTVRKIIKDLEKKGLVISGKYNKASWDQTKWYRVNYEALDSIIPCGIIPTPPCGNEVDAPCGQRIPHATGRKSQTNTRDYSTDTTTERKKDIINKSSTPEVYTLTDSEKRFLETLGQVDNYPLDRQKDLEMYRRLAKGYPELDLNEAIDQWHMYKLDKPLEPNSNPRGQINTSFKKYVEWEMCLKKKEDADFDYEADYWAAIKG